MAAEDSKRLGERLTDDHGFVAIPTRNKRPLPRGWQNYSRTYNGPLWQNANGCGLLTGEESGITVIDIDAPDRDWFDKFWLHHKLEPTTWVETPSGGCHIYYKYCGELKHTQKLGELDIDVRNDGGQIIAPGSFYYTDKASKTKYNGERYKMTHSFDDIRELDSIWLDIQNRGIDRETFEILPIKQPFIKRPPELTNRRVETNQDAVYNLLLAYSKARGFDYESWRNGIFCICKIAENNNWNADSMAVEWSMQIGKRDGDARAREHVKKYDGTKGRNWGLDYLLGQVSEDARKAFMEGFRKEYYYNDYIDILKTKPVKLSDVHDYLSTALIRIDRDGNIFWYIRKRADQGDIWTLCKCGMPFSGTNLGNFVYFAEAEQIKSSFKNELLKYQYDKVQNYKDLVFAPYYGGEDPVPAGVFNAFSRYRHDNMSDDEYFAHQNADFKFVLNHWEETMCGNNKEFYEYTMNWLADLLRNGYKKPATAIGMQGKQGLCKGLMWEELVWKGILGKPYSHVITNMRRFTERFNTNRLYKCLHIFNECTQQKHGSRTDWDQMKSIITDREFTAEPKGKEQFTAVDCAGSVLLSNHKRFVNLENDDRRYAIVRMQAKYFGHTKYFARLARLVKDEKIQQTFFSFLVRRDLSKYNPRKIPMTDIRRTIKHLRNENHILDFLRRLVCKVELPGETWFYDDTRNEKLHLNKRWYSETRLWAAFQDFLDYIGIQKMYWPRRPTIREQLRENGLQISSRTHRDGMGTDKSDIRQRMSWQIDKDIVRELHRSMLNQDEWDYPEVY